MADRALRGMRLGAHSFESTARSELAARNDVEYACPAGHDIVMTFSVEADIPPTWECQCGMIAPRRNFKAAAAAPVRQARTHWDMLLERRTIPELEELLAERLAVLRANRGAA